MRFINPVTRGRSPSGKGLCNSYNSIPRDLA